MMHLPNTDMMNALHLTRGGQLAKATVLLQAMLSGEAAGADSSMPFSIQQPWKSAYQTSQPSEAAWSTAGIFKDVLEKYGPEFGKQQTAAASASEGIIVEGGQFLTKSYHDTVGARNYKVYVPGNYIEAQQNGPLPLVIMLHGCTQSPDDFAAGTRMNVLAEERAFLVAYPEQSMTANSSKCWNWFKPQDQQHGKGEPALIAGITRQIIQDYKVDTNRVYVAGLSAGGAAAAIMGAAYPELYAAVGVHSGLAYGSANDLMSALSAMKQGAANANRLYPHANDNDHPGLPMIVFHGDQDSTVHPRNGEQIFEQLIAKDTYDTKTERVQASGRRDHSRTLYKDSKGQAVHEQWVIHGAGHAWSGGSPNGSYTDPKGPDASREMLRFFLAHPRSNCKLND